MDLRCMLKKLNIDSEQIALAADLGLFFDATLEAFGKPCLKRNTSSELLETKSFYDLCDIWRIRNPTKARIILDKDVFHVSYQTAFKSLPKILAL